jgi:hypothetical protein
VSLIYVCLSYMCVTYMCLSHVCVDTDTCACVCVCVYVEQRWEVEGIYGMPPSILQTKIEPRKGQTQPVFFLRNKRPQNPTNFSDAMDPVWARVSA